MNWFESEVHACETQDHTLDVLYQVVKHTEAFWILAILDVHKASKLAGLKTDVFVVQHDLQFLFAWDFDRLRPVFVVLVHDIWLSNDPFKLVQDDIINVNLFSDESVSLILWIISVS